MCSILLSQFTQVIQKWSLQDRLCAHTWVGCGVPPSPRSARPPSARTVCSSSCDKTDKTCWWSLILFKSCPSQQTLPLKMSPLKLSATNLAASSQVLVATKSLLMQRNHKSCLHDKSALGKPKVGCTIKNALKGYSITNTIQPVTRATNTLLQMWVGFILRINTFSAACQTYPIRKLDVETGKCPDIRLFEPTWQLPEWFKNTSTKKQNYLLES